MKIGIGNWARPFASVWRVIVFTLVVCATGGAWAVAPTATVVWESDFVDNGTKTGTDGNTYTFKIDNTGNSIDNGVLVISSTATKGATIELGDTEKTRISVLVKYSNLSAPGGTDATPNCFASIRLGNGNNFPLLRNENASSLKAGLSYAGNAPEAKAFNDSGASFPNGSGYALFSYQLSANRAGGTKAYVGSDIASLSGKEITSIRWSSNSNITRIALGGPCADNTNPNATAWPNLKIEKVAIFLDTYYSAADVVGFKWPSETKAELSTWLDDGRSVLAWRESASGTGNFHQSALSAVNSDGSMSAPVAMDASGGVDYNSFVYDNNKYTKPGWVLYYDASGYKQSSNATFYELSFGGMCVTAEASDGNPYTITGSGDRGVNLGHPDYTTYFRFDKSFTFNRELDRTEWTEFKGIVNVTVAEDAVFDVNSAQKEASFPHNCALASGATLVMAGEGQMKLGTLNATGGTLDFSKLSTSRETPFIDGTVQLAADTAIKLPAGTTSPYKLGTAITGTYPNSLTIGTKTYAAVVSAGENAGEIAWSISEADMDSDNTLNGLFTSTTTTGGYAINVTESSTLTLDSATTVGSITFNVAEGKTLTLSGSTLTATTIRITGDGMVKATASAALAGTVVGDGTIMYSGVLPTTSGTDVVFTSAAWKGVLWLKDYNTSGGTSCPLYPHYWGSAESKIKWTNVSGYLPTQGQLGLTGTTEVASGWILDNGESTFALRQINGYSGYWIVVPSLHGSGTILAGSGQYPKVRFKDVSNFSGTIDTSSSSQGMGVVIGSANEAGDRGTITIQSGVEISYPSSMTLKAVNGILVKGTLNIDGDATVKFTDQGMRGTLNIAEGKTFTAASSNAVSYDTGSSTVNVYGTLDFDTKRWTLGPNTTINLYKDAIVCGTGDSGNSNAAMDFNVANGSTIHAIGNATVSCTIRNNYANGTAKINVDEGKTLTFSGNLVGSYGLKKQGAGVLKMTGTIAKLPSIEAGTVLLGGNKTWDMGTLRDLTGYTLEAGSSIAITQTKAEYGSGVTTVTGVDSSIASITVNKADGTTVAITPSDGTATLSETAVVSGSAVCNHDYEFDNVWTDAGSDQKDAYTWDPAEPNFLQDGETSNWSVYTAVCPGNYSTFNLSGDWSAAIRCTVPQKANGVIVAFGNSSSFVALAAGETENTARLVKGGGDNVVVTELATMSVAHAATAMHVYAFVKTANAVDIYCDGNLVTRYNGAIGNLNDGFQFGSVRTGVPSNCGLVRLYNSEKATGGNVDYMRIYNFAIDANMIAKLHNDHPYVSPSSVFSRTLDGESSLEWSATDAWTKGGETADTPDAEGIVELTATADSSIAANLAAASLYETLTFKGAGAISVTKATGGATLSAVEVAVDTDTTVAADAVDFTVSRVAVAAGKTLTFDVSGIASANGNWANAASVDRIPLTGIATLGEGATVAVTPATAGYWNLSAVEDGGYWYLSVAPGRATGSIYWQSGTYWNSTYQSGESPAVFTTDAEGQNATKYFAGDAVIIQNTTHRYFGPISDGAIIQFDCSGTIDISKTDSLGYALKNATVTVASGTTLNFVNSWNGASPEMYGGTISGAGKVKVESGITLKLSNGATIAAATALTGAGTVNLASVPAAQMTFDNWTGTVKLPAIESGAIIFNNYGTTGSTVYLTSMSPGAWIKADNATINPKLYLAGDMTLSAMSQTTYIFTEIDGPGALSFATSGSQPTAINITKVAKGYSGTISSALTTPVTIGELKLSSLPACDAKVLAVGGTGEISLDVRNIKFGVNEESLPAKYKVERRPEGEKGDGFYVYYNGTIFSVW